MIFLWVTMTPLGCPVEPEVYWSRAMSVGLGDWAIGRLGNLSIGRFVDWLIWRRAEGYGFEGYWEDAGTIQAYYEANMALLAETPLPPV